MTDTEMPLQDCRFEMKALEKAGIFCLYCFGALLLAASIRWPMGRDQGVFAWVGDVILHGGVPYRDAWEVKGPATYYTAALTQWLFGRTTWGIRVLDILMLFGAMISLFFLLKRFCNTMSALVGPFLLLIMHITRGYWNTAQSDGWGSMLVLIAAALVMKGESVCGRRRFAAGALVGLAAMYKILFIGLILPLMVYDFLIQKGRIRKRLLTVSLMPGGCVFACGVSLFLLWTQGGLADFVDIQFGFNPAVYRAVGERSLGLFRGKMADSYDAFAFFSVVGLLWGLRRNMLLTIGLAVYLCVGLACVIAQGKYFSYHLIVCDAPIAILYSMGLSWAYDFIKRVKISCGLRLSLRVTLLLSLAFVCWWSVGREHKMPVNRGLDLFLPLKPEGSSMMELAESHSPGDFSPVTCYQVAAYVKNRTDSNDYLLVWAIDPLINYLSGRAAPTRFGLNFPLVASDGTEYYDRYRNEFMADVRAKEAKYIVVADGDTNSVMKKTSKEHFEAFSDFSEYVRANYLLETRIGNFDVWRRK